MILMKDYERNNFNVNDRYENKRIHRQIKEW